MTKNNSKNAVTCRSMADWFTFYTIYVLVLMHIDLQIPPSSLVRESIRPADSR